MLNSVLLKESQPVNAYKPHACKKRVYGRYLRSNVLRDKFCLSSYVYIYIYIYVYLYIYEDVITTEVQIYIRGIS